MHFCSSRIIWQLPRSFLTTQPYRQRYDPCSLPIVIAALNYHAILRAEHIPGFSYVIPGRLSRFKLACSNSDGSTCASASALIASSLAPSSKAVYRRAFSKYMYMYMYMYMYLAFRAEYLPPQTVLPISTDSCVLFVAHLHLYL